MRPAACFPESCLRGTSTKLGTNRIQSRVWRATANSRRRQSFQNSADSTAMSSLHPAFFTLSLRVLTWPFRILGTWSVVQKGRAAHSRGAWAPHLWILVYLTSFHRLKPYLSFGVN